MTDPSQTAPQRAADAESEASTAGPEPAARPGDPAPRGRGLDALILAGLVALAALGGWQWYDSRGRFEALKHELAKRLTEADIRSKETLVVAEQTREAATEAQVRIGILENRLAESQSQQIALEALYQELSRNRDEWNFAEIEQSLLIASQQLQLAGNVKAALIALQNADMQLQRMAWPQLTGLRAALNRDIERLEALPYVDPMAISVRLDNLVATVDGLPLAMEVRPRPRSAPPADDGGSTWVRLLREAWNDLAQLVRVERMDKPDVPLLAPPQAFFLRENLKLRLLGARLALLARDEANYHADLKAAHEWLERYFDTRDNQVIHAAGTLRSLRAGKIGIEVPDIAESLEALRKLRLVHERGAR
jgi:uroporphyrin-III C-methyltransferase